jgi:di/tricarboxylate transporter
MGWEAWVSLVVVGLMAVALIRNLAAPDTIIVGGMVLLMTIGAVSGSSAFPSPREMAAGFGNEGLLTVAVLFVVAAALTHTGAMSLITQPLLGRPKRVVDAQIRLMAPISFLSAFLNNTPIVAMFMPVVSDWCKKTGIAPSKLFIPLSYAAILGGTCTLIGTSTNLVVNGLLIADPGATGLSMFTIAPIGVPCAIVGVAYVLLASRWLLPERKAAISVSDDPRQYTVEMVVEPAGPLVGQTIEKAGLRHLPGLYLVEIERDGEVRAAVGPDMVLMADDRLVFVGVIESVVDLRKMRGLLPATSQVFKLDAPISQRCLVEAVVSNSCPMVGKSIREGRFRTMYDAAVIAAGRNGERIRKKIGDIVLEPGDTLLLECRPSFVDQQRNSRDFFLVSRVAGSTPRRHDRAWVALAILLAMVVTFTAEWISVFNAALLAAGLMVLTRCVSMSEARRSIDWQVLIVIGAAFGIGRSLETSGAAGEVAEFFISLAGDNRIMSLAMVYLVTMAFTAVITNNAAAVLVFPIAKATAMETGADIVPYAVAVMFAASNDFATPIGYQTNLMVYGPGGYRFSDYVRFGLPLNLLVMGVTIAGIALMWGL